MQFLCSICVCYFFPKINLFHKFIIYNLKNMPCTIDDLTNYLEAIDIKNIFHMDEDRILICCTTNC